MLNSIKKKLALRTYQQSLSQKTANPLATLEKVSIKRIAIIYPFKREQSSDADNVLKHIFDYFSKTEFTIIKSTDIPKEKTAFNQLPNADFFTEYNSFTYDIIIDLSDEFDLRTAFIVSTLNGRTNVRFYADKQGDDLYHFTYLNKTKDLNQSVAKFLASFDQLVQTKLLRTVSE